MSTRRQWRAAVEYADVIEAEKSTRENITSLRIFAIHPPVEVQHQSLEAPLQEPEVGPTQVPFYVVEEQCRPGVNWWINVAEVPFVCRNLPVGMGVKTAQHKQQLFFGEVEIDQRKRDGVKSQIPSRIPGILPLVGHGNNVTVKHVEPLGIARGPFARSQQRMCLMLTQPAIKVEIVILLASITFRPAPGDALAARLR